MQIVERLTIFLWHQIFGRCCGNCRRKIQETDSEALCLELMRITRNDEYCDNWAAFPDSITGHDSDDVTYWEDWLTIEAIYTHGGYEVEWKVIGGVGSYWIQSFAPKPLWIVMSYADAYIKGELGELPKCGNCGSRTTGDGDGLCLHTVTNRKDADWCRDWRPFQKWRKT
jgi:hypothetical protein